MLIELFLLLYRFVRQYIIILCVLSLPSCWLCCFVLFVVCRGRVFVAKAVLLCLIFVCGLVFCFAAVYAGRLLVA